MRIYWYNNRKNMVGPNVRRIRRAKKLRQRQIAEKMQLAGVDLDALSISRIERGQRFVADYEVKALADALGVTLEELYRDA